MSELCYPYNDFNLLRCIYGALVGKEVRSRGFTASSVLDLISRIRRELPDAKQDFVPLHSEDELKVALDGLAQESHISKADDGRYSVDFNPFSFLMALSREVPPAYDAAAKKVVPAWFRENYPGQDL